MDEFLQVDFFVKIAGAIDKIILDGFNISVLAGGQYAAIFFPDFSFEKDSSPCLWVAGNFFFQQAGPIL